MKTFIYLCTAIVKANLSFSVVMSMGYRIDREVEKKLREFGYYNEDGHELVSEYCKCNEGAKDTLLAISGGYPMQDFVYKALDWFRYRGGGSINGECLADIRANIRSTRHDVQRKRQQKDLMRGIMQGRLPHHF